MVTTLETLHNYGTEDIGAYRSGLTAQNNTEPNCFKKI